VPEGIAELPALEPGQAETISRFVAAILDLEIEQSQIDSAYAELRTSLVETRVSDALVISRQLRARQRDHLTSIRAIGADDKLTGRAHTHLVAASESATEAYDNLVAALSLSTMGDISVATAFRTGEINGLSSTNQRMADAANSRARAAKEIDSLLVRAGITRDEVTP